MKKVKVQHSQLVLLLWVLALSFAVVTVFSPGSLPPCGPKMAVGISRGLELGSMKKNEPGEDTRECSGSGGRDLILKEERSR